VIKKAFDANGIKFALPTVQIAGDGDPATAAERPSAAEARFLLSGLGSRSVVNREGSGSAIGVVMRVAVDRYSRKGATGDHRDN